ncbi:MAG: hypothetical protein HXY49_12090 [Ignavibacteriaceae bacterium]|nr:hypothetical protein [Ignavibacteriaceae bacterium]
MLKNIKNKEELSAISRLDYPSPFYTEIMKRHRFSIKNNLESYIDPRTGFKVFTAEYLYNRGFCCGNLCRHCPFEDTD